jgi:4'-phosphopantetheinyl transferase
VPLALTPADAPGTGGQSPSRGTVDVWSASLEPPPRLEAHLSGYLSPDEKERAERFVFPRDRDRFVAGRAFLRLLLAQYLGVEPQALRFRYGPNGKPALADERSDLHFNLAHSGPLAMCALARGSELGVDLERLRPLPDAEGVVRSAFSPREAARFRSLPETARLRAFYEGWTRKEAFLKALGHGLARPLDSFDVTLGPGEPPRLLRTLGDPAEAGRFSLHAVDPESGYVGAIAIPGNDWQLRHVRWRWVERRQTGRWRAKVS